MGNISAIFSKEMRSYFGSPIAYVMAGVFLLICGFAFRNEVLQFHDLFVFLERSEHTEREQMNVNQAVVEAFFNWQAFIWTIVTPMLTMRLYAEEKRIGTYELLATSPLTNWQILMGKFLACFTLYVLMEVAALSFIGLLSQYARIEWGPVFSGALGTLLLGATFISVGILGSSLTENQIVAVVLSFFMLLMLWTIDWSARYAGDALGQILWYLSIPAHTRDMIRGVVYTNDIVFFLSVTVFFLFVAHTGIESRRWRQ
jgi:ABC-2 type transport system permease protein